MSKKTQRASRRREVLNNPLLRKCVVHRKTRKAVRRDDKIALRKQWRPQSAWLCVLRAALPPSVHFAEGS